MYLINNHCVFVEFFILDIILNISFVLLCKKKTCKICLLKHYQLRPLSFHFFIVLTFKFLLFSVCYLSLFALFLCLLLGEDVGRSVIVWCYMHSYPLAHTAKY